MTDEIKKIEGAKHWFTVRKGSTLRWLGDPPLGIVEVNPDHPPIMHWLGGKSEEITLTINGSYVITIPSPYACITVNVGKAGDEHPVDSPVFSFIEITDPKNDQTDTD